METKKRRAANIQVRLAVLAVALSVAACAPNYVPPQQTQSAAPSVTFKYATDQDLVQTNQSAAMFCERYRSVPRAANFRTDNDGAKIVAYDCVPAVVGATPVQAFGPGMTYTYRTDQELLEGSRNAQAYCQSAGQQQAVSNVSMAPNGAKTVSFQCMPR